MEYMGLFSFSMMAFAFIYFAGYPSKIRKMQHEITKLKNKINGGNQMSKLINSLIGKKCAIIASESYDSYINKLTATILDADDEWVKLECIDKKMSNQY